MIKRTRNNNKVTKYVQVTFIILYIINIKKMVMRTDK